jgi:hypothetical protein
MIAHIKLAPAGLLLLLALAAPQDAAQAATGPFAAMAGSCPAAAPSQPQTGRRSGCVAARHTALPAAKTASI